MGSRQYFPEKSENWRVIRLDGADVLALIQRADRDASKKGEYKMTNALDAVLKGRDTRELAGSFPAVVDFEKDGDYIMGRYFGSTPIPIQGGKTMKGHRFALDVWSDGLSFTKKKIAVKVFKGDMVSCSGQVLDVALENVVQGTLIAIEFKGHAEAKGKNNPAKLYRVEEVLA